MAFDLAEFFEVRRRGSTLYREVVGGLTTFMAMSYILFVQPAVLGATGMDRGGVFMATCLASGAACIGMGLLANYPIALAPGMGENFFFVFTLCGVSAAAGAFALTWPEALALTAAVGVVFLLMSTVGLRATLLNAIPDALKSGIAAGIGLFIALIGFEWGNVIRADSATFVHLADLGGNYVAALTGVGLAVTMALVAFRVRGGLLIGILVTTALTWAWPHLPVEQGAGLVTEPGDGGLVVRSVVPCSPAAQGGKILPGDVISAVDGKRVRTAAEMTAAWKAADEVD